MRDYTQESADLPNKKYSYNFDEHIREYLVKTYSPFFSSGWCLEIGCGNGELTKYIDPHFSIIRGVDPLINTTLENHLDDNKYDAIIMHNVLEHIDDTGVVFERIKSLLNVGGLFFVSVPNANAASRQIAVKMGILDATLGVTNDEYAHGHRRTYNLEKLTKSLKDNGFIVIHNGGIIFKALSNWQMDASLESGIISPEYIDGCYELGMQYPELCATIYAVCKK